MLWVLIHERNKYLHLEITKINSQIAKTTKLPIRCFGDNI